jgi:adenosylcobinamide kinase/adenosylcobinamide-phosphate guanylyltransferase
MILMAKMPTMENKVIELVLGGARSGKSSYAEKMALHTGLRLYYIATGQALDEEMGRRIASHQKQRQRQSQQWQTVEEPLKLAEVLTQYNQEDKVILVDCLTLWLSNHLLHENRQQWQQEKQALLSVLSQSKAHIILVSNEVGQGIVPLGEINRRFVDEAGWLHQALASVADKVSFVTAGLVQQLK